MTKTVVAGGVKIGGESPVTIQSMLAVPAEDVAGNVAQAIQLEQAGCQILRVAIPNRESIRLIPAIKEAISIPLVADIHFDYRLALESVAAGIDKIRLNPGNIGGEDRVAQVAKACGQKGIPIRIGVNSGSLEKEILARHGSPTPQALVESALFHASLLEKFDFDSIVLSIKSSDVPSMIQAYRLAAEQCDYPLHLGVTEAGTKRMGILKSAVGIGSLLVDGIGSTFRISLTDHPVEEIKAAKDLLLAIGLGQGPTIVSCPTCGRTRVDLIPLAQQVETALEGCTLNIKVAVMGCVVNGPGEARGADVGVACGDKCGLLFRKGEVVKKVPQEEILPALMELIAQMEKEQ
ncbi:flavodoxin-dependent (E)-4-hydroxy-3-methylbut-2-enyl-diphosphate synthase [Oscillospiraceae bacterium MB08-C2-2]|nr:flavodoxin-dependent (E)-4-hydroxy-3-methylbut-2-enyl-diphosphate synthase [Oscillospiraceae bacterium MB08-C2-2]